MTDRHSIPSIQTVADLLGSAATQLPLPREGTPSEILRQTFGVPISFGRPTPDDAAPPEEAVDE